MTVACLALASMTGLLTPGAAHAASDPTATVFYPNPVQSTGDESLTDGKDRDSAAFTGAYRTVTLTDLDGSGTLTGRYVMVESETGKAAQAVNRAFPAWHRDSDQFEQVMGGTTG